MSFLLTAFLLGLAGSLHCVGMCGPLALALPSKTGHGWPGLAGSRMLYNTGRITTYCALGALFGWLGRTFSLAGWQQTLSIVIGSVMVAGVVFKPAIVQGLPAPRILTQWIGFLKSALSRQLTRTHPLAFFTFGLLNGLLPCGLVYVALGGAALAGHHIQDGVFYMAAFGLGTLPAMFAISISGGLVGPLIRQRLQTIIPVFLLSVGILFILRGMSLGIPYISPDLSQPAGHQACCPD